MKKRKRRRFVDWGKPRRKLENWGKPRVFGRKAKKLFAGAGPMLVTAALTIGIFVETVGLVRLVRQVIENKISENLVIGLQNQQQIQFKPEAQSLQATRESSSVSSSPVVSPATTTQTITSSSEEKSLPAENLVYASFSDLFSGDGWLNDASTTMYRDVSETAFMFLPKYAWRRIGSPGAITLSSEPRGITTKIISNGGRYKVLVYAEDGSEILGASSTPIVSDYPGSVGIGGTQDDFLVVYGSYEGAGARISRSADGSWKTQDISRYLGARVMNGGITPDIIRIAGANHIDWYIWNAASGSPRLIKLFTDSSGQVRGAVDFTSDIFTHGETAASFEAAPIGSGETLIAEVTDSSGGNGYYDFTDLGFDKSSERFIFSSNVNTYPGAVREASFYFDPGSFENDGSEVHFYISNDGVRWYEDDNGTTVSFPNADGRELLWKADFKPSSDTMTSPYLDKVGLYYRVDLP